MNGIRELCRQAGNTVRAFSEGGDFVDFKVLRTVLQLSGAEDGEKGAQILGLAEQLRGRIAESERLEAGSKPKFGGVGV